VVWNNLDKVGIDNDLSRKGENVEKNKDINESLLPRYLVMRDSEFYKILFEYLENE
jgi:hypothetical protein